MSFPLPNAANVCILIGDDACNLPSTLCDVHNMDLFAEEHWKSVQLFPLTTQSTEYTTPSHKSSFPEFCLVRLGEILASVTGHVFLFISGDASQFLPISAALATLLKNSTAAQIIVLADMCQSGCFLNLNASSDSSESPKIFCISACNANEFDQDDISVMGFDGGLTADLIDYLTMSNVFNVSDFFQYRTIQDKTKEPPIHSILSHYP